MSRKEETGDVGQVGIAGNFNTRFIFRKEEKKQIAAMAGTGESYRSKESWPRGPGFGYPQREFALLKVH